MDFQTTVIFILLAASILFLGKRLLAKKEGCGNCGCGKTVRTPTKKNSS